MPNNSSRFAVLLATVMAVGGAIDAQSADDFQPPAIAPGIRQVIAKHLTLYTDLAPNPDVDNLGEVFDLAFPQWCARFGVDEQQHADWHMRGYLMKSRERFEAAGLVTAEVPASLPGFARGDRLWMYDQASVYYRRHLLLHEGTHAFMDALAGGLGPPWFAEGMAELMATHRWEDGRLTLEYFPRSRDEVPKWGRIEIVQTAFAARRAMSLSKIFAYDTRAHVENEPYGWCWAAAAFLEGHPRYRERFRPLYRFAGERDFPERVMRMFADDWERLNEDWQLFVADLDYGYDFARADLEFAAGQPLPAGGARITVAADRGWQPSGVKLVAGQKYRLVASGRYQVGNQPRAWECEPNGVTIRYWHGRPLGILLAAVRSDDPDAKVSSGLLRPSVVGLETTLVPERDGTLYLRINDSAGSLNDNAGSLSVELTGA